MSGFIRESCDIAQNGTCTRWRKNGDRLVSGMCCVLMHFIAAFMQNAGRCCSCLFSVCMRFVVLNSLLQLYLGSMLVLVLRLLVKEEVGRKVGTSF